jgi:hypothetical protein
MSEPVEPKQIASQDETPVARPRYEPPKLILLNELTIGRGAPGCINGSGDSLTCGNGTGGI